MSTVGAPLAKGIADLGAWKFVMAPAPDDVLIELVDVDASGLSEELRGHFEP